MNKSILSVGLLLFLCLSCSSLAQNTETRSLASFNGIKTSESIEVIAKKGNKNEARISASGVELDEVISKIDYGRLKFELDGRNHKNVKVRVELTYTGTLKSLAASSAGSLEIQDDLNDSGLDIECSSAGKIVVNGDIRNTKVYVHVSSAGKIQLHSVSTQELEAKASSAGHIEIKGGSADELEVDVSSSGSVSCENMKANDVNVEASSGGGAKVHVDGRLNANASSGGWVKYKGSPSNTNVNKSSGGRVRSM
ncbi:MAG: GIN domain-containing protein [Flammeovirgaceae bacterium]